MSFFTSSLQTKCQHDSIKCYRILVLPKLWGFLSQILKFKVSSLNHIISVLVKVIRVLKTTPTQCFASQNLQTFANVYHTLYVYVFLNCAITHMALLLSLFF